ncbi:hypothetical protein MVEN_00788200 [Mycena venus]|uniref:Uncharacterized protein n=1 Tax=Mycena venus TaxID=2733690 RepID=A0A8H6YKX1_9AGAR|nr:hypothetical protein MVEN_00788200 [Mycena venus]
MSFSDESTIADHDIDDSTTLLRSKSLTVSESEVSETKTLTAASSRWRIPQAPLGRYYTGSWNRASVSVFLPPSPSSTGSTGLWYLVACLGFYFVVRNFMAKQFTLDYRAMNVVLGTLIFFCGYCACMSLLLLSMLVLVRRGHQWLQYRPLYWVLFATHLLFLGFLGCYHVLLKNLLTTNPLIPVNCALPSLEETDGCLPDAIALQLWAKAKLVAQVVYWTLAVHSFFWTMLNSLWPPLSIIH